MAKNTDQWLTHTAKSLITQSGFLILYVWIISCNLNVQLKRHSKFGFYQSSSEKPGLSEGGQLHGFDWQLRQQGYKDAHRLSLLTGACDQRYQIKGIPPLCWSQLGSHNTRQKMSTVQTFGVMLL